MTHFASPEFWYHYRRLPSKIRLVADKNFALLKVDPSHPSLRLKKVGRYWSVRVGLNYRALARQRPEGLLWFWVGPHAEYDSLIS
ncbi:MAG: hypothetical protein NT013_14155 [Planctomycetia bacterium]|nr:hypothetical protein [Planctomycetia bacterium]